MDTVVLSTHLDCFALGLRPRDAWLNCESKLPSRGREIDFPHGLAPAIEANPGPEDLMD